MKKRLLVPIFLCISFASLAQSASSHVISPAGGYAKNNYYSLEWTLGEVVVSTGITPSQVYTQGFNQSYLLPGIVTGENNNMCRVFAVPNPVHNSVVVTVENPSSGSYTVRITDVTGLVVYQKTLNGTDRRTTIDMQSLAQGMYLLQVYDTRTNIVCTTKLIKQ